MDWNDLLKPEYIWAIIGIVFLIMELFLPGVLISFFGVGALLVAVICCFTDISLSTQLIIFMISSVLLLLVLRKWLKGIFSGFIATKQDSSQNIEDFVGKKVTVIEAIKLYQPGIVELNGVNWKAQCDVEVPAGAIVEIVGNDNLTLIVKAIQR